MFSLLLLCSLPCVVLSMVRCAGTLQCSFVQLCVVSLCTVQLCVVQLSKVQICVSCGTTLYSVWCLASLLLQPLQNYYRKGPLIKWWWPALCYRKALCAVLKGRRLSRISFNRLSSFFSHIIRINISLRKTEFRCDFPYQAGGRGFVYTILGSGDLG